LIEDPEIIEILGELGLILLLFFIGMEISLPDIFKMINTAFIGVIMQVTGSIAVVLILGLILGWSFPVIIFLGFVIALSSTAVVIKLLEEKNEINTAIGQHVVSILIMQDLVIVPMILITEYLGGKVHSTGMIIVQIIGSLAIISGFVWILKKKKIKFPFQEYLVKDHELQVFVAILFCFGFAILTSYMGLSAALGAFFAGILVHASDSTKWFHESLHSFRIAFVSMFFVSIGFLYGKLAGNNPAPFCGIPGQSHY
jgi:CPA2 family monovalent cation:H+ antiporter-2